MTCTLKRGLARQRQQRAYSPAARPRLLMPYARSAQHSATQHSKLPPKSYTRAPERSTAQQSKAQDSRNYSPRATMPLLVPRHHHDTTTSQMPSSLAPSDMDRPHACCLSSTSRGRAAPMLCVSCACSCAALSKPARAVRPRHGCWLRKCRLCCTAHNKVPAAAVKAGSAAAAVAAADTAGTRAAVDAAAGCLFQLLPLPGPC